MPANIVIENDASAPITSINYGSIGGGNVQAKKYILENQGDTDATSVQVFLSRLASNDGLDFAQIGPDVNGNPGTYQSGTLNIGTVAAGSTVAFWTQVVIPVGTTPAGNPRQFDINAEYAGT